MPIYYICYIYLLILVAILVLNAQIAQILKEIAQDSFMSLVRLVKAHPGQLVTRGPIYKISYDL